MSGTEETFKKTPQAVTLTFPERIIGTMDCKMPDYNSFAFLTFN